MHIDITDPRSVADFPSILTLLREGDALHPDRTLIDFAGEVSWTWSDAVHRALAGAGFLQRQGVTRGARVVVFASNGPAILQAWWACSVLGAVIVPVNTSFKGELLRDVISRTEPTLVLVDPALGAVVGNLQLDLPVMSTDLLVASDGEPALIGPIGPWEPHAVIFTSGTTGRSKASVASYAQVVAVNSWPAESVRFGPDDALLVDLPMFHLYPWSPILLMLRSRARLVVLPRPSLSAYWETAREHGVTYAMTAGSMADYLIRQPARPADRDHTIRTLICSPLPADIHGFRERFGVENLITGYGATESGAPIVLGARDELRPGTCGKRRPGYELRIVDEHDLPVPRGTVGELILRTVAPWIITQGYYNDAEATAATFLNGWFHTGDLMFEDGDGYFYVHDRTKDSLRRRGENISSFEVEREVMNYPGILDVACVRHPSGIANEDDIKVFLVVQHEGFDIEELFRYLAENMSYFMVPRYYEIVSEFPRTVTSKTEKHKLRARGNSASTWDCEQAGYRVTREGLRSMTSRVPPPAGGQ